MGWPTGIEPVLPVPQTGVITISLWPPCDEYTTSGEEKNQELLQKAWLDHVRRLKSFINDEKAGTLTLFAGKPILIYTISKYARFF